MPDRHGTKGMWVDWMLEPYYDFQLWPHPWSGPWIFKVKFWNCCIPGMAGSIDIEQKGYESIGHYTYFVTLSYDLDLGFSRSIFLNSCISGMGVPINMEWKGYESIGCYSYYVTLSYDFDLGFWRSNFEKALIIGIKGWIDIKGYESIGCSVGNSVKKL